MSMFLPAYFDAVNSFLTKNYDKIKVRFDEDILNNIVTVKILDLSFHPERIYSYRMGVHELREHPYIRDELVYRLEDQIKYERHKAGFDVVTGAKIETFYDEYVYLDKPEGLKPIPTQSQISMKQRKALKNYGKY